MHSMDQMVEALVSTWYMYIKALKLSVDDRLLVYRDKIVGINHEASKLQVIEIPDSTLVFSAEYRNVSDCMNQTIQHMPYDTSGIDHHMAIMHLSKYLETDKTANMLWYTDDFCSMYPSVAKMTTAAGYEIIKLPPGFGIVMIPGLFSSAMKDNIRLEIKDLGNGCALVKFSHYKRSIKAAIDIYTTQMLLT